MEFIFTAPPSFLSSHHHPLSSPQLSPLPLSHTVVTLESLLSTFTTQKCHNPNCHHSHYHIGLSHWSSCHKGYCQFRFMLYLHSLPLPIVTTLIVPKPFSHHPPLPPLSSHQLSPPTATTPTVTTLTITNPRVVTGSLLSLHQLSPPQQPPP